MSPSAFARVAARLVEREYSIVPIAPGTKSPGHIRSNEWRPMCDWQRFAERQPSRFELAVWCTYPDAGIGVVADTAGWRVVAIDIDSDDATIAAAIIAAIPPTTVIKKGAKGSARFYRGPAVVRSKSWRVHGNVQVCDLIGPGRQTVVPPSVHPSTGRPYRWIGPDALEDTDPGDLPELTPEHVAAIDEALRPFGYCELERRSAPIINFDEDAAPHRALNNQALANLGAWVPGLDLFRCRQTRSGYEAVATWRPSNTGRLPEQRKLNLKISTRGIVDFGAGPQGYTALDLIMAARNCNLDAAFCYLADALGWCAPSIVIGTNK
jgi:Bifunctional DNA primase/polymerase, N-terminal